MLASVLWLDADGVHVRHGAAPSLPESFTTAVDGASIGPRAGSCGTAAYRHEPVIVEDIAADHLWDDYRALASAHGLRSCWSTPIFDRQRNVLGTFALYFREPARPSARHQTLIDVATHVAAIAITKQREADERRRAEDEIRRREAQLAEAQQVAQLGSYEWDVATNSVSRSLELLKDLKAPLRGIAGYAQELDRRHRAGLDERALVCIDRILTATRNLDQLIEDLLQYSRLDAETPTPRDIDLSAVV
ncbi:MAG TPA: GAF domain-containing protein [Vicinamibacterales bacterium]|nr:GAF domain-containing protein [Vicinamibacterales bacterium]